MVFLEDATLQEKEIKKGKAVYRYYSKRFADRGDHMYKIQVSFTGEFWKLTYFGGVLYILGLEIKTISSNVDLSMKKGKKLHLTLTHHIIPHPPVSKNNVPFG